MKKKILYKIQCFVLFLCKICHVYRVPKGMCPILKGRVYIRGNFLLPNLEEAPIGENDLIAAE